MLGSRYRDKRATARAGLTEDPPSPRADDVRPRPCCTGARCDLAVGADDDTRRLRRGGPRRDRRSRDRCPPQLAGAKREEATAAVRPPGLLGGTIEDGYCNVCGTPGRGPSRPGARVAAVPAMGTSMRRGTAGTRTAGAVEPRVVEHLDEALEHADRFRSPPV